MRARSGAMLVAVLVLSSVLHEIVVAADPGAEDIASRFGGSYRRPLPDDPSSLDPALTTDVFAYMVLNQIFDGLVQFDSHLNPIPAIAGFWEASLDGLTWTFYLRKGVRFHNGREVVADDFVYSFSRILQPALKSPVATSFKYIHGAEAFLSGEASQVEGLRALDRYTLQIVLKEPYAPFLSILAMANAKVVPREEVEKPGAQFGLQPVGSGPFRFLHWKRSEQIVLQAYDYYFEGRPFLDQIVFKIGKRDLDSLSEFLNNELEESMVPATRAGDIREDPRYRRYRRLSKPTLHLLYIGFNTQQEPFTNPKVRQAFNYAINKEEIVRDISKWGSVVAHGILPPGMPGYDPEPAGYYYNPRLAKQLLAEAGYPNGKGMPVIHLWHSSKEGNTPKELLAYREYLAELGVTIEIHQAENWPAFKKQLEAGTAPMFRLGWHSDVPDPDNFFFPLLHSQSKTNRTFYRNARVDQLLEQAHRETNYLRRIDLYREIEKLALRDAPWISQHHRVFEYLYQPYVRGVDITSLGAPYIPMKGVWLERAEDHGVRKQK